MLKYKRPKEPSDFKTKSKNALSKLRKTKNDNGWPKFKEDIWQDMKCHFTKAQFNKCGYCESQGTYYNDVEHFRPKGEVQYLKAEGKETANAKNVNRRLCPPITDLGYWWLAYSWDNYLLSCEICNRTYKKSLFPLKDERKKLPNEETKCKNPTQVGVKSEEPLLLNPFDKNLEPHKHFKFLRTGIIEARQGDKKGFQTIKICGLHRLSLREMRLPKLMKLWNLTEAILIAEVDSPLQRFTARQLFFECHESAPFAGMARIVMKDRTSLTWPDLIALLRSKGWYDDIEQLYESLLNSDSIVNLS